jgi:crotonobetainyl-CoA:carnitine CoA-transferase CaiB-like acyl-CoA transferase
MTARDLCWTEEMTKALMNEMMEKKKYVEVLEVFEAKFGYMFTLYRDEEDYEAAREEYEDGTSDEDEETDDEDDEEDEEEDPIARIGAAIARINARKGVVGA